MPTEMLQGLRIRATGVPIYLQLRDQLLAAIAAGRLGPGERLPTMREVAVALRIDLNTVRRAYDELQRQGAVMLLQGRGSFVAEGAAQADHLDAIARRAITDWATMGLDASVIARRVLELAAGEPDVQEGLS
jgi:GntR family transcriptional regulator